MATDEPLASDDVFSYYGRKLLQSILSSRLNHHNTPPPGPVVPEPGDSLASYPKHKHPIGILGGGMAGLYTGLILASLKIPFQILEATDRIGGRCFTYHFKDEGAGEWDYYDVGAMRFPLPAVPGGAGPHRRLSELFKRLDLDLLKYIYKEDAGLMYFNGEHGTIGTGSHDGWRAREIGVPPEYITAGVDALCHDFIDPLANLLLKDIGPDGDHSTGWEELMKYDHHSTRSYLASVYRPSKELRDRSGIPDSPLPTSVINWMEMLDKSTGWYDRALTETVLESLAFGIVGPKPEWWCISGGTSVLPEETLKRIQEYAKNIPKMPKDVLVTKAPVTKITPSHPELKHSPLVVTAGGREYTYSHVISSIPLPAFAHLDTSGLNIATMQRAAIRQLQYGPSIKIGMLFKSAWWKEHGQVGGQSFTDLPIRTVVYPSYGSDQESKVLIASYCWTNDAERLGSLINTDVDNLLDDLVIRNLATIHGVSASYLREQLVQTYSWNWTQHPWTGGAFAFFGPGQFKFLYDAIAGQTAADDRLQWAGELLSVRHAWIVGALDSGWVAVLKYLMLYDRGKLKEFYKQWGANREWSRTDSAVLSDGGDADEIADEDNLVFEALRTALSIK